MQKKESELKILLVARTVEGMQRSYGVVILTM
jgi:hypothetical protein